jgi:hypothetical protein
MGRINKNYSKKSELLTQVNRCLQLILFLKKDVFIQKIPLIASKNRVDELENRFLRDF